MQKYEHSIKADIGQGKSVERRIDNDIDLGRLRNEVAHDICAIVALQRHERGADSSKRRGLRRDIRNEITVSEQKAEPMAPPDSFQMKY